MAIVMESVMDEWCVPRCASQVWCRGTSQRPSLV